MAAFPRMPHGESQVLSGPKTAEDYLRMQQAMGRFYLKEFMADLAGLHQSGDFLEIGCGPGYQTVQVARQHPQARIEALEPSKDMITIARDYMQRQGVAQQVGFTRGLVEDATAVQALGTFDLVYSTFSLHHWQDPVAALGNIGSVLKDGGKALIYDFRRGRLMYWLTSFRKGIAESVRASYTKNELVGMLEQSGIGKFRVEKTLPYLKLLIYKTGGA